jgi:F-type H+-transporting ATPase subunit c
MLAQAAVDAGQVAAEVAQATGITGNIFIALVGLGATLGVGLIAARASEAVGRNPGAFGKIFTTALIGMALAEGLAILAFFVVPR